MNLRTGLLVLLLFCPAIALAQDDSRIDSETGAEQFHYPPARLFDHLHMRLAIDIPDMGTAALTARELLTVAPIGKPRSELTLDALGMKIGSVRVNGAPAIFFHDKGKLRIAFPAPVPVGRPVEIAIDYSLDFSKGPREQGLTWLKPREGEKLSPTDTSPLIYSQGEAEYNHRWFACHDFPNERLTTELLVTVEDGYTVVSNGRLVGKALAPPSEGTPRTTWHWLQDKPHANYLVTLVIGRYSIVGLMPKSPEATPRDERGQLIPCYLYAPIGKEAAAAKAFAITPGVIAFYNERFGQVYPWDKYAQVLVRGFNGGMENTSATTMMADLSVMPRASRDSIISHEAGHQWFGDLMTCKSWEHAWLNEGWASFCEALWEEHAAPPDRSESAYQRVIAGFVSRQRRNNTTAPGTPPMVSGRYDFAMQNFMKTNDIYSKGALVLHMLRVKLGDEAFWKGVRLYIQRFKFKEVETDDFRHCLEEASGRDLERFFWQWCYRPGMPRLEAELEWKPGSSGDGGELSIALEQKQQIDADNPAYALSVPILVSYKEGASEWLMLDIDGRTAKGSWSLKAKPEDVEFDPDLHNAVPLKVSKPLAMWLHQARSASVFAQLQAAEHLSAESDARAVWALVRLAIDPQREDTVREAAAAGLAVRAQALAAAWYEVPARVKAALARQN